MAAPYPLQVGLFGRRAREQRANMQADLEAVRRLTAEDVVHLGEELARFDARTAGVPLDDDARVDLWTALEAYDRAGTLADRLASADEVTAVVEALSAGRFALACVAARMAGDPLPQQRTPCFFNPQHGPATTEVLYHRPGRGTRQVPACAQDAARHFAGEDPEVRYLVIDGRRIPYWEAGRLLAPYARGYFPTTVTEGRRDARALADVWQFDRYRGDATGPL